MTVTPEPSVTAPPEATRTVPIVDVWLPLPASQTWPDWILRAALELLVSKSMGASVLLAGEPQTAMIAAELAVLSLQSDGRSLALAPTEHRHS